MQQPLEILFQPEVIFCVVLLGSVAIIVHATMGYMRQTEILVKRLREVEALLQIKRLSPGLGELTQIAAGDYSLVFAQNRSEFSYILQALVNEGLVENPGAGEYRLTLEGWRRLGELQSTVDGHRAFVAMWFSNEMA